MKESKLSQNPERDTKNRITWRIKLKYYHKIERCICILIVKSI